MKILYLHGWNSSLGGVKPTFLRSHGHDVIEPALDHGDFEQALATAQAAFDEHRPDIVVGSSRGGAVAMNLRNDSARLVLLCPAWRKWGSARTVEPGTVILHSRGDDVIPFQESLELVRASGLPDGALVEVGTDHRLADLEPLEALARAVEAG
jgi:pimeloyl-ACP methyl ester carboxylesterase